ncbi:Stress-response A/B barrel domain-containing protein HS1 [Vitis vinifera]|uniref:Stress-response A/B barrel domain-containing protein HS1 n=1 Tax=Vitis vinifera TaxID=29760 RepID=A0A438C3X2_VITVI|nr:Stress-response A/B barrel domain-containing protein HS1 [Vitis vinifera]
MVPAFLAIMSRLSKPHVMFRFTTTKTRGKDVSIENMHQGFTHVFESTFESVEGIAEYVSHPAHVEFANLFLSYLEKVIVFDYKPITVHL